MLGPPNYRNQATEPQAMLMQANILQSSNNNTLVQQQPYQNQATHCQALLFAVLDPAQEYLAHMETS